MTRKQLQGLTKDQLVAIAVKQGKAIDEIRGYESGMDADKYEILDSDTLIDCIMENEKNFKLNTTLKEEKEMKDTNKGGKVEIIEIVVEGIKYTQTRPGYYFKKTEEGQKRIPKSEWEQAFEKYTEEQNQWDAEDEIEARKDMQDAKDKETEDSFNGKKKAVKKVRRSKDIAVSVVSGTGFEYTITARQADFIRHLPDTNFWEHGLESMPWIDILAEEIGGQFAGKPMTVGAMISTLREKGLITVGRDESRKGKPKYMMLTVLGKEFAKKLGLE